MSNEFNYLDTETIEKSLDMGTYVLRTFRECLEENPEQFKLSAKEFVLLCKDFIEYVGEAMEDDDMQDILDDMPNIF